MHLIIGTSEGVFVGDEAGKTISANGLEGRSVRHLGRPDGDLLAGTATGVFRSADGGRSWRPSGVEGRFVWDIVTVPGDARRLYAGTEPVGLFKSEDAGRTWTEIPGLQLEAVELGDVAACDLEPVVRARVLEVPRDHVL